MLKLKNITATLQLQPVLDNISLEINAGEIHAIMGPKHSGKSALAHVITRHPAIEIQEGNITFNRKKIHKSNADEVAKLGIFISFQYPPEFDFISNFDLLKAFTNTREENLENLDFDYKSYCDLLKLDYNIPLSLSHSKRNELIWMLISNPKLIIIDEIDSQLTDNEIILVAEILKEYLQDRQRSCLVITHNQTLLDIINPTHVHVMVEGKIVMSGENNLYKRIIKDGYSEFF